MIIAAGTLGPTAYWYLTRATGMVSLILLTAVVVLGVLGPMRLTLNPRWPRFAVDSLHRDVSLLAIALIVVHVITTVLDGFAPISLIDALIPLHSAYRPLWLGLGALAFDLILALVITSLVRRSLGYRAWRAVHWLAYACWPVAVLHGLGTGSDSKQLWALGITYICILGVAVAVIARIRRDERVSDGARVGGVLATAAAPILILIFTVLGPLAPHWSQRAGTPTKLLVGFVHRPASTTSARTANAPAPPPATGKLRLPFTDRMTGRITQSQAAAGAILDMELRLSGQVPGALRIRLGGQPLDGGGLSLSGSQVDLVPNGVPVALQGRVTSLEGTRVSARVSGDRKPVNLTATLQIDDQSGSVTGVLRGEGAR